MIPPTEWSVVEWCIAIAALLGSFHAIYKLGVKPVRDLHKAIRAFMVKVTKQMDWIEFQMKPNHGTSVFDKVNDSAAAVKEMRSEIKDVRSSVRVLQESVVMLLEHDAERDVAGMRYGPNASEQTTLDIEIIQQVIEDIKGDDLP